MAAEPTGFHWSHPAIEACLSGEADGLILPIVEGEKPHGGLARVVDLRFFGAISQFQKHLSKNDLSKNEMISGAEGECVWIPLFLEDSVIRAKNATPSLYLFGLGEAPIGALKSKRLIPSTASLKLLAKNLKSAGGKTWAVSRQDFGDVPESFFQLHFPKILFKIFP